MAYAKPLPTIDDGNREFWEGARNGKLRMQRCAECSHIRYPINHVCPKCLCDRCTWHTLSGSGEILSYIVFHQKYSPAFAGDLPYNVALVQLAEGPRMFGNIVVAGNDVPKVGDRVQAVFDAVTPEVTIPRFALVRTA
jgi:uncharacterized OB-fold protein